MSESDVHEWVSDLPFKMQAVLLSALRGCDGVRKEDPSKALVRKYRALILKPAAGSTPRSFMHDNVTQSDVELFLSDIDHYPLHWYIHFMHAAEIVGWYKPDD